MVKGSFIPEAGQRVLLVGQTGSGKTVFEIWLAIRIPIAPVVIYDTKIEPKFDKLPDNKVVTTIEEMLEAYKDESIDYIIVRPPEELLGEPQRLDDYLWQHYLKMHHSVALIDEGGTFHSSTGRPYKGLLSLLSRGRSKGILTIICTQRPVNISRSIISESQAVFAFRLKDLRDREVLDNVIPDYSTLPNPKRHWFYYSNDDMDRPELFRPIKLDAAMDTGYTDQVEENPSSTEGDTTEEPSNPATKHVWV